MIPCESSPAWRERRPEETCSLARSEVATKGFSLLLVQREDCPELLQLWCGCCPGARPLQWPCGHHRDKGQPPRLHGHRSRWGFRFQLPTPNVSLSDEPGAR